MFNATGQGRLGDVVSPHSVGVIIRRLRNPPDLRHEHELAATNEALGITQAAPAHEAQPWHIPDGSAQARHLTRWLATLAPTG